MPKYSFKIEWSDEDEGYIVTSPEFPGMSAFGTSVDEAMREGQIALRAMIKSYEAEGEALPAEKKVHSYSGQFRVRISKSLHQQAAEMAEKESVSLNHFVTEAIARAVGNKESTNATTQSTSAIPFIREFLSWQSTFSTNLIQSDYALFYLDQEKSIELSEAVTPNRHVH